MLLVPVIAGVAIGVATSSAMGVPCLPRYLFRDPAMGLLASGPGMTVAPCRTDGLGGGVTGPEGTD